MTHAWKFLRVPVLLAALVFTHHAAAEPVIVSPQEPVPIGGFADVEISGLEKPASLTWSTIPDVRVRVSAVWGKPDVPILSIPSNAPGTFNIVVAFIEGDKVVQQVVTLVIGSGTPVPVPPIDPTVPPVTPPPATTVKMATFVYEKDEHAIPNGVLSALNKLNRERGILATVLEADTTDGTGDVPAQYKEILAAAKTAGLPCLVLSGAAGVIRIIKAPKTEAEVLDAVPAAPAMRSAG